MQSILKLTILFSGIMACGIVFAQPPESPSAKPNILLLLADDMGYNDMAAFTGNKQAPTPTLDGLAQQGMRFSRFYTESTCAASRVALLTGRYPARAGFRPVGRGIPPEWTTLPEFLKSQGYKTHHVGKWHMGFHEKSAWPASQGFDTSFGFLNQWLLSKPINSVSPEFSKPGYNNPWLQDELGNQQQYKGHLTDILSSHTVKLIQESHSEPWFIYHAFFAPHRPIQPAKRFETKFPNSPEGKYLALLAQLDNAVKQIVVALESSGQLENTLIIFASDNGGTTQHKADNNYPFYGKKNQYYEGGTRTPAFFYWKDQLKSTDVSMVTHIMDIYPAITSLLGIEPVQVLDGNNILTPLKKRRLFWNSYGADKHIYGVLSESGKYRFYDYVGIESFSNLESTPSGEPVFSLFYWLVKNQMKQQFQQWLLETSQVEIDIQPIEENGIANITGNDFQRSPGLSGFTLGIGVTPDNTGEKQIIAYQEGLLEIVLEDNIVKATIEGITLTSRQLAPNQCHTVVLSTHMLRDISILGKKRRENPVKLFINGSKVQEKISNNNHIPDASPHTPLQIGRAEGYKDFKGSLVNPVIYNSKVEQDVSANQLSIKQIEPQLCIN